MANDGPHQRAVRVLDRRAAQRMAVLPEPLAETNPPTGTPGQGATPAGPLTLRRRAAGYARPAPRRRGGRDCAPSPRAASARRPHPSPGTRAAGRRRSAPGSDPSAAGSGRAARSAREPFWGTVRNQPSMRESGVLAAGWKSTGRPVFQGWFQRLVLCRSRVSGIRRSKSFHSGSNSPMVSRGSSLSEIQSM